MAKTLKDNKTAPNEWDAVAKPISKPVEDAYAGQTKFSPDVCKNKQMQAGREVPGAEVDHDPATEQDQVAHQEPVADQEPGADQDCSVATAMLPSQEEQDADKECYVDQGTLDQAISMVQLLANKMSERLAFERINTKLYDGLIAKCETVGELKSGPSIAELRLLRQEKVRNFMTLEDTLEEFGADPMELTASADCALLALSGLPKVVTDTETSVGQALDAVLIYELADREGWNVLVGVCERLGRPDLSKRFEIALSRQKIHLQKMRTWVLSALVNQA